MAWHTSSRIAFVTDGPTFVELRKIRLSRIVTEKFMEVGQAGDILVERAFSRFGWKVGTILRIPTISTWYPRKLKSEWTKHVVEGPAENDVVVTVQEEDYYCRRYSNSWKRILNKNFCNTIKHYIFQNYFYLSWYTLWFCLYNTYVLALVIV